jgi:hypothetical protein
MWRTVNTVAAVCVAALALAGTAAAKWGVELASTPAGLEAGEPWHVEITVIGDHLGPRRARSQPPVVRIRSPEPNTLLRFPGAPVGGARGTFETTVRFPKEGRWRYSVRYNGATFGFPSVVIAESAPADGSASQSSGPPPGSTSSGPGDGGSLIWPLVGVSVAIALFAVVGFARLRGRRLRPWPTAPSSARTASRGR